jgi:hypothetical protein
MITQYEVPGYLTKLLPAFTLRPQPGHVSLNIYRELQYFTDYTRKAIDRHNYELAKKCFHLAGILYAQGDAIVKNAIENIFVFSFSSIIPQNNVEKVVLKSFIPVSLYALYLKQISHGGC